MTVFTGDGLDGCKKSLDECPSDANSEAKWIAAGWDSYDMGHCWLSGKALSKMLIGQGEVSGRSSCV